MLTGTGRMVLWLLGGNAGPYFKWDERSGECGGRPYERASGGWRGSGEVMHGEDVWGGQK